MRAFRAERRIRHRHVDLLSNPTTPVRSRALRLSLTAEQRKVQRELPSEPPGRSS
jgi:hypothetical protein